VSETKERKYTTSDTRTNNSLQNIPCGSPNKQENRGDGLTLKSGAMVCRPLVERQDGPRMMWRVGPTRAQIYNIAYKNTV